MSWIYTVNKGIKDSSIGQSIQFESSRHDLRRLLRFDPLTNKGRFESEDSYENIIDTGEWIRLTFDEGQKLSEIEVLSGTVYFNGIKIEIDGDLTSTIIELEKMGTKFTEHNYGFVSSEFKFDLGSSAKSGGEDDKISWFYSSTDVRHLLE